MSIRGVATSPIAVTVKVLIVDDEPVILKVWRVMLRAEEFEVTLCSSGTEALQIIAQRRIDVVVTDVMMPGMDGMELLKHIKATHPEIEVLVMTAKGSIADAVRAMREGAFDYLTKPFVEIEECVNRVRQAARLKRLHDENVALRQQIDASSGSALVDSASPSMRLVGTLVSQVTRVNAAVLLTGPTGSGKSAIARSIHDRSGRKDGPFVHVDCGALPETLIESELFGHLKGAFTTAIRDKEGLIEAANGGTLFLDEIGNLDLRMQQRLLKVLDDACVRRVGGTKDIKVDVRIISATHIDLAEACKATRCRLDLYQRLKVVEVKLPGLADRQEDIPRLAYHFLRRHAARCGKDLKNITPKCMEVLKAAEWEGNIRELDHAIERAVIFESSHELTDLALPDHILKHPRPVQEGDGRGGLLAAIDLDEPMREAMERAETAFRVAYLRGLMSRFENVTRAAKHADVERANFRRLLKRYDIKNYSKGVVPAKGGESEKGSGEHDEDDDD